ncbi:MAG: putative toxin-antitoxin system toxin component, PIN family [Candidatus Doudnabacteria bacterium]|nr:putative toxin-antitoxin system toxin component, PIN family [Candidatus Doudnabacteria bacterium]
MFKVVIDTNLLIDGSEDAYNYGNRIIDAVIAGHIQAFANRKTLRENQFIAPQKITDQNYLQKLNYFFASVNVVDRSERLNVVEDEEDNKFVEAAIEAGADYIITADQHLLKLEKYNGIKIVRPAEFWNTYQDESGDGWTKWLKDFIK